MTAEEDLRKRCAALTAGLETANASVATLSARLNEASVAFDAQYLELVQCRQRGEKLKVDLAEAVALHNAVDRDNCALRAELDGERAAHSIDRSLVGIRTGERNAAYLERNQVVALLAAVFPSWRTRHSEVPGGHGASTEPWDPAWLTVIGIQLPSGQATWHCHDDELEMFRHVPEYDMPWDGHTSSEKYERIARHVRRRTESRSELALEGLRSTLDGLRRCL